jgi:hypothetical protein
VQHLFFRASGSANDEQQEILFGGACPVLGSRQEKALTARTFTLILSSSEERKKPESWPSGAIGDILSG